MAKLKRYINADTVKMYVAADKKKTIAHLLWGDRVTYDSAAKATNGCLKVKARGREGYVEKEFLGTEKLLELYFIDVGQGDGVLIKTPDEKHIMIDGGYKRRAQQSGKNAADFIDWKFAKDYGMKSIELDAMIASHNDADHYGGLWDLINPAEEKEMDIPTDKVNVKKFYHAGVAWLKKGSSRNLGPVKDKKLTLLVEDLADIKSLLKKERDGYLLQGEWASFMQCLVDKDIPCERLSQKTGHLKEFEKSGFSIKVLSPIEVDYNGKPAYDNLGSHSINTNGHSVTLRVDYKAVKIMLTGDLNAASQQRIMEFYGAADNTKALACDVAKSCHHGSDDCSFEFLSHLGPGATVISSGDAEGHCHPRPSIVAASALTGHKQIHQDKVVTPLIYSTEISRSYKLGSPQELKRKDNGESLFPETEMTVTYLETNAGDLNPARRTKSFWDKKIVGGIIYGLVNVRTDGETILCATMSEKSNEWDIKKFKTRF